MYRLIQGIAVASIHGTQLAARREEVIVRNNVVDALEGCGKLTDQCLDIHILAPVEEVFHIGVNRSIGSKHDFCLAL